MEDEAAGALDQLADVNKRLEKLKQSAQYYERATEIFERLGKLVAAVRTSRSALNTYKKLGNDEKVSQLKKRMERIEAKQQSINIEKQALQKAMKETDESLKKGLITKEHSERIQESLNAFLKEIDKKIRDIKVEKKEGKKTPSTYVTSNYVVLELQKRIAELSVKMANLEVERKKPSGMRFTFMKILCSASLFVAGIFFVIYCTAKFPLSIGEFLTLGGLIFAVLASATAAIWKV